MGVVKNVMGLTTFGLVSENTEKVIYGKPVFAQSVSFAPTPVRFIVWIQDELEKWNGWIATRELAKRVALGIAWVPGYIWQNLGFASTAHSEMRQTGEDANILDSNLEIPETDVSWERN